MLATVVFLMKTNEHIEGIKQRAVKAKSVVSIQEFYSRLQALDWFFSMADNRAAYENGARDLAEIELIASFSETFQTLLDQYRGFIFSGDPWNTPKLEAPEKPTCESKVEMMIHVISHSGAYLMQESSDTSNEVWDKTDSPDGHFLLSEISGTERKLGVLKTYDDVCHAASIAVNFSLGGYDEVLIENITLFDSVDQFIFD